MYGCWVNCMTCWPGHLSKVSLVVRTDESVFGECCARCRLAFDGFKCEVASRAVLGETMLW